MKKTIKIMEIASDFGIVDGNEEKYLVECDVDANYGRGNVITTNDISKAMLFNDAAEALRYWGRQSKVAPLRNDGRPNKPLTAYTVEITNADEA